MSDKEKALRGVFCSENTINESDRCVFKITDQCGFSKFRNSEYCIYHKKDRTRDEDAVFLKEFEKDYSTMISAPTEEKYLYCVGFIFPPGFSLLAGKSVDAHCCFIDSCFLGDASFRSTSFQCDASFHNAMFKGKADFSHTQFHDVALFPNARFERVVVFSHSRFQDDALFEFGRFLDTAELFNASFGRLLSFMGSVFKSDADFSFMHFPSLNSDQPTAANFQQVTFLGPVHFRGVLFPSASFFQGSAHAGQGFVYSDGVALPRGRPSADFWRLSKQARQNSGEYRLAGEAFYREQCNRWLANWKDAYQRRYDREELGMSYIQLPRDYEDEQDYDEPVLDADGDDDVLDAQECFIEPLMREAHRIVSGTFYRIYLVLEFLFGRLLFGYGERPFRVVVSMLFLIVVCACLYAVTGDIITGEEDLLEFCASRQYTFSQRLSLATYFSVVTSTTLGYGDWHPKSGTVTQVVSCIEAFSGALLMALFVVTLARRFGR